MSTKKPAGKTTAKKAAPKKAAPPRSKPATSSSRSASRSKAPAKKPTVTTKGAKTLRSSHKKPNESNVSKAGCIDPPSLYDVTTVQQASAMYGGLTKTEARKVRKQFFVAGRRDLAAAPRH